MHNKYGRREKIFILVRQIGYLLLFSAFAIWLTIALTNQPSFLMVSSLTLLSLLSFFLFIYSLLLSCKIYTYNGNTIIVYAGHWNHYIKINDTVLDEHKSFNKWFTIYLSATVQNDTFEARITNLGRISFKINNKLYK